MNEPRSHNPPIHFSSTTAPAMRHLGSYGVVGGTHSTILLTGSLGTGSSGSGAFFLAGTNASHSRIDVTPEKSSFEVRWLTPFVYMICVPPS